MAQEGWFDPELVRAEWFSDSIKAWFDDSLVTAASGGGSVTGTASLSESSETLSASGSVAVSGSYSATESAETLSASGQIPVSGSYSATEGAETVLASGTVSGGGVSGTGSLSESAETLSATGSVTLTGSYSQTESAESVSASGSIQVTATGSLTEGTESLSATGSIPVTANGSLNESSESLSASGEVSGGTVTGTLNATLDPQTLSAVGSNGESTFGGGYDDKKRRKRNIVNVDGTLYQFSSEREAISFIESLDNGENKKDIALPERKIRISEVKTLTDVFATPKQQQVIQKDIHFADWDMVLAAYDKWLEQDEEEALLLLL